MRSAKQMRMADFAGVHSFADVQELVALQAVIESFHDDSIDHNSFVELCSRTLTQLEEEQYVFQYLQVHA